MVTEEEKKSELFEALHLSMISSDESDGEDDTLSTKHLVWRAEEVSSFFKELDSRHRANMSTQQRRQSVNRQVGRPSTVPEATMKCQRNCSGPLNCNYFLFFFP